MKRILILTEFFPPNNSGVSQSVKRLVEMLRKNGQGYVSVASIEPLTENYPYQQFRREESDSITIWRINVGKTRPLNSPEDIRYAEYIVKKIVLQNSIEAIHAYNIFNVGYIAYRIFKEINIPYILSIRGNDLTRKLYSYSELYPQKLIIFNAEVITCVNGFLHNCLLQNYPEVSEKAIVIYNSIIPESQWQNHLKMKDCLKRQAGVQDKFVFTYIGEVKEKKQTLMLMDAFMRFNEQYPDTLLYVVGYVYQEEMDVLNKMLQQCCNIIYVPKVKHEEVGKFYAISDAFVQMSYDDGLPNSLLEAIYMQVPIIASTIFSDVLTDGENALLTDPFSKVELIKKMRCVYSEHQMRNRMIESASKLLSGKLSVENEYLSFVRLYEEI